MCRTDEAFTENEYIYTVAEGSIANASPMRRLIARTTFGAISSSSLNG
jgi:hypothetical protein